MKSLSTKDLTIAGFFLALGLLMPFLTVQLPGLGSKLLPMHIPIILCGFVCGWRYGMSVGFVLPIFRSMLFGMPPMFPTAVAMSFELAAYGLLTGFMYRLLPKKEVYVYVSLISAMIGGRIIWGVASLFLYGLSNTPFGWKLFIGGAFLNAIPGIVLQIMIIPVIIFALKRVRALEEGR